MGCDIHLHEEVKINGKWHHYSVRWIHRNYRMFARLADVRNYDINEPEYIQPISQPRGIPEDSTELTKFDCDRWGVDGHSHSWIGADEIREFKEWYAKNHWAGEKLDSWWFEDIFGYMFSNGWDGFTKYPEDNVSGLEDIRFVFWFDN